MLSFIKKLYSGYVYIFLEHKLQNHTYTVHTSQQNKPDFQQISSKITQIQETFGRLNLVH